MTDDSLLALIQALPGLTTAAWAEHFAVRRRMGAVWPGFPQDDTELVRQLAALERQGLIEDKDGWQPVYERLPVGPRQGSLFG